MNRVKEILGDGTRADGFENFMQQTVADFCGPEFMANSTPEQIAAMESRLRVIKALHVTAVEVSRREYEQHGRDSMQVLADVSAGMGNVLAALIIGVFTAEGYNDAMALYGEHFANNMVAAIVESTKAGA